MGFNKPSRIQGASLPIILGSNGVKYAEYRGRRGVRRGKRRGRRGRGRRRLLMFVLQEDKSNSTSSVRDRQDSCLHPRNAQFLQSRYKGSPSILPFLSLLSSCPLFPISHPLSTSVLLLAVLPVAYHMLGFVPLSNKRTCKTKLQRAE